ncbi:MAG: hypothetical protein M9894_13370 [Planctomycetes bacterium]|nr:hypothetical protein [Planctomycetota bacterium]
MSTGVRGGGRARALTATVAAAAALAGCGTTPEFRPLAADRTVPVELAASHYDVRMDDRDVGHVKVWSVGPPPREAQLPADRKRLIQIGVRIRNDAEVPMRLDLRATDLEIHTDEDRIFVVDTPALVNGLVDVGPGRLERVELLYALPAGVRLEQVRGYELVWALEVGGERMTRATMFRRAEDDRGYYYYPYGYPYGAPYLGAWGTYPWGLGFGAGYRYGYWW